ncbi:hypothetical protein [Mycoplasma suis]|uniref:Uncharacterized protein n=1 Tax=Mycoplasma suis (strain KI_3806) TaxID=708248 RepID=F0V349_MYCS3|nr:hypothetical protein [Mycoplasma suis]CBZ40271.1 hypothetical protein MSUIS_01780 [Mycoplasma suis KI3806]
MEGDLLQDLETKSTIESFYSEVQKNEKTKSIEKKSSNDLVEAQGKLTNYKENFKSALQEMSKWKKDSEVPKQTTREKRASEPFQEQLNVSQRKALLYFYKEFCGITDKQTKYSEELKEAGGYGRNIDSVKKDFCSEKIVSSLEKIGWEKEERISLGQWVKISEGQEDPFSFLLEDSYLKEIREKISSWGEKLNTFRESLERQRTRGWWGRIQERWAPGSIGVFSGEKKKFEDELSYKIAQKLMEKLPISQEYELTTL